MRTFHDDLRNYWANVFPMRPSKSQAITEDRDYNEVLAGRAYRTYQGL
jgi:hypothetical protein